MISWGRWTVALAAMAAQVVASSPSPDVSGYLARPPGADWVQSGPTADSLVGTVTPDSYSAWANDGGAAARALRREGFVTGYGEAWEQKVTRTFLSEFVLAFETDASATRWYNGLKLFDQTSKYYTKDIPALAIPLSVGVEWTFSDGSHEFAIEFAKGNLFYDVAMDADTADLAAATLAQAQTEYDAAPDSINVSARSSTYPAAAAWVIGLSLIAVCFLVATIVFVLVRSTRRQASVPALAAGFQMSADGVTWWDGVRWRDATIDVPPGAQRSPDGNYWWDGRTWRRTR